MWNRCKQIVERLAIVWGMMLGGEIKGRYIVERINSAANPCENLTT